jgi:hypothetical protein
MGYPLSLPGFSRPWVLSSKTGGGQGPSAIDFLQGMMYKGVVVEKRREKKGGFLWAVVFQEGIF